MISPPSVEVERTPQSAGDRSESAELEDPVASFSNKGAIPPIQPVETDVQPALTASERAFGDEHGHQDGHATDDPRRQYVDQAKHDRANPGTRKLTSPQRETAMAAMVPRSGENGGPTKFREVVDGMRYGDIVQAALAMVIPSVHKELYDDKVGLRADPEKNLHAWSALEGPAKAAKQVTDGVYDTNYGGPASFPAMTAAGGNLLDQWEFQLQINKGLDADQKQAKARTRLWYLINSNLSVVHNPYGAVPADAREMAILTPIVESFVSDAAKVQAVLEIGVGWPAEAWDGKVYLQRDKKQGSDKNAAKEANRVQMWELFHVCIHEYLHSCGHPAYYDWAYTQDSTRRNTLVEGVCDFFTLNVRSTVDPKSVQATVEGPYANGGPPPAVKSTVYPSHKEAERVVSIVGTKNVQAAYFRGETELMGKTGKT